MKEALLIIDYQFDFADPKGKLYVPDGEKIKDYLLELIQKFKKENKLIIATKDWHPQNHISFDQWGEHCLQDSPGAKLVIDEDLIDHFIYKGMDLQVDSYGAFFDDQQKSNGLDEYLKEQQINKLVIVGLAEDVCVKNTFEQAKKLGYEVTIDYKGTKPLQK